MIHHQVVSKPHSLDVQIAGAPMDTKDALSVTSLRWCTDAIVDVVHRIAPRRSNYLRTVLY
jgi:hypothetical protein